MTQRLNHHDAAPVSERVVEAVADATNTDPLDLEPLYTRIDPDALDAMFGGGSETGRTEGRVSFPMAGCQVVVTADGTIDVSEQRPAETPKPGKETVSPSNASGSPD